MTLLTFPRRLAALLLPLAAVFALSSAPAGAAAEAPAAAPAAPAEAPAAAGETAAAAASGTDAAADAPGGKILVAYFSRAGENYAVGTVEKGNTRLLAETIAAATGADLFEIVPETPYPENYRDCADAAKRELAAKARPKIVNPPANLDGYGTVILGYPIWWGDMPMPVYTFLESYDFTGKTVLPFCTHEGSGLAGTAKNVAAAAKGAAVSDGLAVRGSVAQKNGKEAREAAEAWLRGAGLIK